MAVTNYTITDSTPLTVLSTANAKLQLRLESSYTDEDTLIDAYVVAAISNCENFINGHIQPKTLVLWFDQFQNYEFETYPVIVSSVKYYKKDEASLTTLATTDWYTTKTSNKKTKLVIDEIPGDVEDDRPDVVQVTATLGYASANLIPEPIVLAIKLQVSDMYERREDRASVPVTASQNLLRPYRNYL